MQPSCCEFGLPALALPHFPEQEFARTKVTCVASRTFGGSEAREAQAHTQPALCQNPTLLWNVETANDTLIPQSLSSSSGLGKYWERHMLGST